jgi:hypothetical protein
MEDSGPGFGCDGREFQLLKGLSGHRRDFEPRANGSGVAPSGIAEKSVGRDGLVLESEQVQGHPFPIGRLGRVFGRAEKVLRLRATANEGTDLVRQYGMALGHAVLQESFQRPGVSGQESIRLVFRDSRE